MSETPMVTFSSVDNPNTWNIEGESKCLVFASPSEARRAEELFAAMQRELAAERERAERLMERLQQESERCDKEVSQRIWADTELQRERERADRNQEDAERLDWMDKSAFTAYRERDPEYGELYDFATVVNEDRKGGRVGEVFKTIREAIDAARRK